MTDGVELTGDVSAAKGPFGMTTCCVFQLGRVGLGFVLAILFVSPSSAGLDEPALQEPTLQEPGQPAPTEATHTVGGHPSALPYSDALRAEIAAKLTSLGEKYEPRTRHFRDDGRAQYTNRLILENSPYLLQHAHNPVDWYPWGDEAFEAAKRLGRPVLMSVGYTTCHWCHVMEEESFEDPEIAAYINEHYIAIKVDRERRPDVDSIYMDAVRIMTGRGGWPMTIVMSPDRKPFFGGTYFPARDGDRGTGTGFFTILQRLLEVYQQQPERVQEASKQILERINMEVAALVPESVPDRTAIDAYTVRLTSMYDSKDGGFGRAPKFPRPVTLDLLLRTHRRTGEASHLDMVAHTLNKMADGGIYDQVGSGFHRYATDAIWLVPHFEKMLYDNAQLVDRYLSAYQATDHPKAARVARDVLDYVLREMTSPQGGFYSATDADSKNPEGHTEEGWYFTWTPTEIAAVLSGRELEFFNAHHTLNESGNFEGRNILHVTQSRDATAAALGVERAEFDRVLRSAYDQLYRHRETRPKPILDDKILVGWNGLMIGAAARGSQILDEPRYLVAARSAADFIRKQMYGGADLRRSWRAGQASHRAVLADYAFYVSGLLDLFEASQEVEWLELAIALQAELDAHFWDEGGGGYYMAHDEEEGLLVRQKPAYDGAIPCGNSYATMNLLRLHQYTTKDEYRARAERCFGAFAKVLNRGGGMPALASALDWYLDEAKEIIIVKPTAGADASAFLDALDQVYLPNRIVMVTTVDEAAKLASRIPLVADKTTLDGKVTAYVCQNRVCKLPTADATVFAEQIREVTPYPDPRPTSQPAPPSGSTGQPEPTSPSEPDDGDGQQP